ncbi:hypothetical protein C1645_528703 [Glomus cerebriforme]|uniref:Uncharacterized protein n=1 Tax=Glomus cerebriforme TaxID=658196 RepID=A0A397T9H9_9GLOM|nr:hypothetical protein C1645_528703 [Glomus cerebriforme]
MLSWYFLNCAVRLKKVAKFVHYITTLQHLHTVLYGYACFNCAFLQYSTDLRSINSFRWKKQTKIYIYIYIYILIIFKIQRIFYYKNFFTL